MNRWCFRNPLSLWCMICLLAFTGNVFAVDDVPNEEIRHRIALKTLKNDPFIQEIVDQVSTDSLTAAIQRLQDFETRFALEDSSYAASAWLKDTLARWGYTTQFDSFYITDNPYYGDWPGQGWERNVIAQRPGIAPNPETYFIGGHFDSIVQWPDTSYCHTQAPGADDAAVGIAAVLETARIFRQYAWDPNLYFTCWAAEELNLLGSAHYADSVAAMDMPIDAVLNLDQIGWDRTGTHIAWLNCQPNSRWIADLFTLAAATYAPELLISEPEVEDLGADYLSFARNGYQGMDVCAEWCVVNPYRHTIWDTLETLEPELYTLCTRSSVATLGILCIYPGPVGDVAARDVGNGSEAAITWTPATQADVVAYKVRWGTTSGAPTDSLVIFDPTAASCTLGDLDEDILYYVTVWSLDGTGHESYSADEVSVTPRLAPKSPSGVVAEPLAAGIRITWKPNEELDLAGYRVYWRTESATGYDSLSTDILPDTTMIHSGLSGALHYYYAVRAFDTEGNAGALSEEAYGRPITLDQGILLVDETHDTALFPDSLRDEFYACALAGYAFSEWDFESEGTHPLLADLGPYSTIVWHTDDYSHFLAPGALPDLEIYLESGGNLMVVGWKPVADFVGSANYPFEPDIDSFARRFLKVDAVDLTPSSDLVDAAIGVGEAPSVHVNPEAIPTSSWQGKLKYIEALIPTDEAMVTHTMHLVDPGSGFQDAPCGIRSSAGTYQTALLTLPLSYTLQDEASTFMRFTLEEFGEVVVACPPDIVASKRLHLMPAEPNPFTSQTMISYELATAGMTRIAIYDISGRQVKILKKDILPSGHGTVLWDGKKDDGSHAATGIYLCVLRQGNASVTGSVALLR